MNHSYIPPSLIGSAIGQLPPGSNRSRARQGASIQAHYTSTSPYTPHPGHHHYSHPLNRPETTTQTVSPSTLRSSGDYGLPSSRLDPSVWLPPSGATAVPWRPRTYSTGESNSPSPHNIVRPNAVTVPQVMQTRDSDIVIVDPLFSMDLRKATRNQREDYLKRYTTQLAGALSPTRRGASAFDMVPIIKARIEAKLGEVGTLEPRQISQGGSHVVRE
ncbi:hypothetical protein M231_07035 [Tremella mesenterica]|uniref:Uncharacterized protein n=1 Tax=Tremella mesenterica TaxID=5217 RepID=A0A4Q1BCE0_TREME|nr:hypothetical protein M231_07035 [Tremella mesenterica]